MLRSHQRGDSVAVIYQGGHLRYSDFDGLVDRLCSDLALLGLSPGDRVLTILPNSLELLLCYYACLKHGLIIVPISDRMARREVQLVFDHARPKCAIGNQNWASAIAFDSDVRFFSAEKINCHTGGKLAVVRAAPEFPDDHPAAIFYTSGSTGDPKGVLYTHGTLRGNCRIYGGGLSITANDHSVLCHCLNTNFVFAQLTYPVLAARGTVQIVNYGSVDQTLTAIESGATFLSLIPWFGFKLIDEVKRRYSNGCPNRLRSVEVGGDRVPQCFFQEFEQAFGIWAQEHLGMVETNTTTLNPMIRDDLRIGSVGMPLPEVSIEIRDVHGSPLPLGSHGQIWVRTPAAMDGYWCDDEASRGVMDEGWVATGDVGHFDPDGYLWFVGRLKQMIICDGDNIHAHEIEQQLELHPEIDRACVVGLPHKTRGETVAAVLLGHGLKSDLTIERLAEFLKDKLSPNKIPQSICLLDRLPETHSGKIDREAVKHAFRR